MQVFVDNREQLNRVKARRIRDAQRLGEDNETKEVVLVPARPGELAPVRRGVELFEQTGEAHRDLGHRDVGRLTHRFRRVRILVTPLDGRGLACRRDGADNLDDDPHRSNNDDDVHSEEQPVLGSPQRA